MGGRMVLAAVLGGVVLFLWGFVSHALIPLGMTGHVQTGLANEDQIASLLKQSATQHAVYWIPGGDHARAGDDEAYQQAWIEKSKAGPFALVMVDPDGRDLGDKSLFVNEFATDVGMALIAVFLIVAAGGLANLLARCVFCVLLCVFGFLQTDVRLWNWDGFPPDLTVAGLVDHVIAGVLLGIVISLVLKRR